MSAQAAQAPLFNTPKDIWQLNVNQYHAMIEKGILTENDPVEFLEGWLICKMPKSPRHRLSTQLTREVIEKVLPQNWYVDAQEPITLDNSEPEPDVLVVRGKRRDYSDHHPKASDVAMVIEVSDSTLERDQNFKKGLYADADIAVYWIINLNSNCIEVYSQPKKEGTYSKHYTYSPSDKVPIVIDSQEITKLTASEFLP